MQKFSLEALGHQLLERPGAAGGGHTADTVVGGHERILRQTVIAMLKGAVLAEHENPGEATVHVLHGRVRLSAGDLSWEGRSGDLLVVPEARGGACSAQLILSDEPVLYPYVTRPDIMVVMSQEAYNRFAPELKPAGMLIIEEDLVRVSNVNSDKKVYSIPATRIAEGLGKRMVLNSVMVGFFTAVTKLLTADAVRKAVADSVPPSFRELNLQAFEKGFEYGNNELAAAPPRQGLEELAYSSE